MGKNLIQTNRSFWEQEIENETFDCLVIGRGIVGCSAALSLRQLNPDWKIGIIDATNFTSGASTRNAGFATFGSISEILADVDCGGLDYAINLIKKRWDGLTKLISLIGEADLNLVLSGGYETFYKEDEVVFEKCIAFMSDLNNAIEDSIGLKKAFTLMPEDRIDSFGMDHSKIIANQFEGMLHPGKMMASFRKKLRTSFIRELNGITIVDFKNLEDRVTLLSSKGENLHTKKVIFATNGFSSKLFPDLNIIPARNQVLLTTELSQLKIEGCFHHKEGYYYWRNVGKRVLIGGARNIDLDQEETEKFGRTVNIETALLTFLQEKVLPNRNFEISHKWSGIMGIGDSKEPIVKEVFPNIFAAIRLGGMGVAIGSEVGHQIANLVTKS